MFPNFPIVGQPGQQLGWYPTIIWRCLCIPDELNVLVITGIGNPSECQKCGGQYVLAALKPTPMGLQPQVLYKPKPKPL